MKLSIVVADDGNGFIGRDGSGSAADGFDGCGNHFTFDADGLSDLSAILEERDDFLKFRGPEFGVRLFTAAESHDESDAIAVSDEAFSFTDHGFHIVVIGFWTESQFFKVDTCSLCGGSFFSLFVAEFTEVHDTADGWFRGRCDLNEIESVICGDIARLIR